MFDLPPRAGAKPKITSTNPRQQQSQNPTPEVYELLPSKVFDFPHIERRPSAISVPGAQALWLSEEIASARPGSVPDRTRVRPRPPALRRQHAHDATARGGRRGAGEGLGEPHPIHAAA
jgi:phospholipase/carboxylesterase